MGFSEEPSRERRCSELYAAPSTTSWVRPRGPTWFDTHRILLSVERDVYIQLWPEAFFCRLFSKHATDPGDDALRRLLTRPEDGPASRKRSPGRVARSFGCDDYYEEQNGAPRPTRRPRVDAGEDVLTITITDRVLGERLGETRPTTEREGDDVTSYPHGSTRTCRQRGCNTTFSGPKRSPCPQCGTAR